MKSKQNHILLGIFIVVIISPIIAIKIANSGSNFSWLFLFIFALSFAAFPIVLHKNIPDYKKNIEKQNLLLKQKREQDLKLKIETEKQKAIEKLEIQRIKENLTKDYVNQFGNITKEIKINKNLFPEYKTEFNDNKVLIFESSFKIIIQKKVLSFADIIAFELKDDEQIIYKGSTSTSTSSTSTKSMIGRAVVGGVLLGGVGAIVGGVTAKKNISTINTAQEKSIIHKYKVNIIVNSISEPHVIINLGENEKTANEIVAVLSVILEKNKSLSQK